MPQSVNISRRSLLQGKAVTPARPLRPPGAMAEAQFTQACTACGDCVSVCPQGIVYRGPDDFPRIDFRQGECTFCSRCIEVCTTDALQQTVVPPWRLTLHVADTCLARRQIVCQTCSDTCSVEAIRFRPRLGVVAIPAIDAEACTGCGACIAACPENALSALRHE